MIFAIEAKQNTIKNSMSDDEYLTHYNKLNKLIEDKSKMGNCSCKYTFPGPIKIAYALHNNLIKLGYQVSLYINMNSYDLVISWLP